MDLAKPLDPITHLTHWKQMIVIHVPKMSFKRYKTNLSRQKGEISYAFFKAHKRLEICTACGSERTFIFSNKFKAFI